MIRVSAEIPRAFANRLGSLYEPLTSSATSGLSLAGKLRCGFATSDNFFQDLQMGAVGRLSKHTNTTCSTVEFAFKKALTSEIAIRAARSMGKP